MTFVPWQGREVSPRWVELLSDVSESEEILRFVTSTQLTPGDVLCAPRTYLDNNVPEMMVVKRIVSGAEVSVRRGAGDTVKMPLKAGTALCTLGQQVNACDGEVMTQDYEQGRVYFGPIGECLKKFL